MGYAGDLLGVEFVGKSGLCVWGGLVVANLLGGCCASVLILVLLGRGVGAILYEV